MVRSTKKTGGVKPLSCPCMRASAGQELRRKKLSPTPVNEVSISRILSSIDDVSYSCLALVYYKELNRLQRDGLLIGVSIDEALITSTRVTLVMLLSMIFPLPSLEQFKGYKLPVYLRLWRHQRWINLIRASLKYPQCLTAIMLTPGPLNT